MDVPRHLERYRTAGLLVAANLVPAFGVLVLGWDVFQVMVLYWMESAVIGMYTVLKTLLVDKRLLKRLSNALALTGNFSIFMYVHMLFLIGMAGMFVPESAFAASTSVIGAVTASFPDAAAPAVWLAALFAVHGYAFARGFLSGGGRNAAFREALGSMLSRLFYTHIFLFGAFFIALLVGPSSTALEMFVVATKVGVDLFLQAG